MGEACQRMGHHDEQHDAPLHPVFGVLRGLCHKRSDEAHLGTHRQINGHQALEEGDSVQRIAAKNLIEFFRPNVLIFDAETELELLGPGFQTFGSGHAQRKSLRDSGLLQVGLERNREVQELLLR